jgi:hypothetical protein
MPLQRRIFLIAEQTAHVFGENWGLDEDHEQY